MSRDHPTPDSGDDHHDGIFDRLDDFKDRVEAAAIQAEFDTGEREETVEEAKSHALVRLARMTLGTIVVLVGIAALPLPGPGWLIIAGGLTILSKDVAWADRLLRYIRKRVPGIPEDGKIPRSSLVTMALVTLAAVSASLWWTLARGSDEIQAGTYVVTEIQEPSASTPTPDPGIEIDLATEGPVTVRVDGCEPIDLEVLDRSKATFALAGPSRPDWSCPDAVGSRLVTGLTDSELQLGYSTDGLFGWFLADDALSSISGGDEAGEFQLAVG